jgi:hypothetical protein
MVSAEAGVFIAIPSAQAIDRSPPTQAHWLLYEQTDSFSDGIFSREMTLPGRKIGEGAP